jgi:hypothetical protein
VHASRGRQAAAAGALYLAVSLLLFGLPVLPHFRRDLIGSGGDPQLFVWSLGWWPHAVLHGHNPFVTHVLWTPHGSNLAWTTSIPGLALLLAPVTLAAGAVAAYNTAAILLPALAAWTAFLLCRHLTRSFWASLAGGYLFGFSTYVIAQELGHLHMSSVFLVPLAALVLLRFLEGGLGGRGLVVRLGPLLALQLSFSTEVFFTLTVCLVAGLLLGAAVVPARRRRLGASLLPLLGSYVVSAVIAAPFLYYAATDYQGVITPATHNPADLVNVAFPTRTAAVAGSLSQHFVPSAQAVSAETGQYLGLPLLAIVALFAVRNRRRPGSRFLVLALGLALVATLGSELRVRDHALVPLPWRLVRDLPLFDNVIPSRFAVYAALPAALIASLWAASPAWSRSLRIILTGAAIAALVPAVWRGYWHEHPPRPAFFADGVDRLCLGRNDNVLVLPPPFQNAALLWQAESGYRFRLADGALNDSVPRSLPGRETMLHVIGDDIPPGGAQALLRLARLNHVDAILVDASAEPTWPRLLDPVLRGRNVGGLRLYRLDRERPGCRQD